MGKKTKRDKESIELNLDILMNLIGDIADRNPKIKALINRRHWKESLKDNDHGFSIDEYEKLFKEIYGDVFPIDPFPVWRLNELEDKPHWLVLKIDLNYTRDEIMHKIDKYVSYATEEYRQMHVTKIKRKQVKKWIDYLEIWDLKNGYPPPKARNLASRLQAISFPSEANRGRSWTYEEIAKYLYPNHQAPEQLLEAIDLVKKQYRAAYKLICGEKYGSNKSIDELRNSNNTNLCEDCPDHPHCKTPCPILLEDLNKIEVKQQHILSGSSNLALLKKDRLKRKPSR